MAWHIAKVGVSLSGSSAWHIAKVGVQVGVGRWHIAKVGIVLNQQVNAWHIAKVKVVFPAAWHLVKVLVGTSQAAAVTPALAPIADQTVDPVQAVVVTATVTNGVVPDSYSFSAPGIALTVVGNQASFIPPGTLTGGTVTVTITATKGANTSAPVTANFLISPDPGYYEAADGSQHAVSLPYYSK